MGRVGV
ncbi:unnamed protein product, partial [Adineta steineri]